MGIIATNMGRSSSASWSLPVAVLLLGDRLYPSAELVAWLHQYGWRYCLQLKGNLMINTGVGDVTTGELARGINERDLPNVRLFTRGVPANLGILYKASG